MSASESAAESSSLGGENSEAEAERSWVALVSTPRILAAADQRARAMAHRTAIDFDLLDPPKSSFLVLHPRIVVPDPDNLARQGSAYILAADRSGRLLFRVTNRGERDVMYLCNAPARRAITLPPVPYSRLQIAPQPLRSIGLVADPDPDRSGQYLVAQLYPGDSALDPDRVLCFSTATSQWGLKPLLTSAQARLQNPWFESGVLAHDGRLYWLNLAYGVFVCDDPFAATPNLRFVRLPADCEVWEEEEEQSEIKRANVAQRRRVAPSEGLLRFVEIRGLSYDVVPTPPVNASVRMWTLVDPDAEQPWSFEDEAPFAEVWEHPSYTHFGLPHGEVPHAAFVDPDNLGVVYLLQGDKLYGLDMGDRRVVSCEDFSVRDDREIRNCRNIIDAWELPPPPTEPSAPDGELLIPGPEVPAPLELIEEAGENDNEDNQMFWDLRQEIEDDIECVQRKINEEQDFAKLEKLLRQRAHLKRERIQDFDT